MWDSYIFFSSADKGNWKWNSVPTPKMTHKGVNTKYNPEGGGGGGVLGILANQKYAPFFFFFPELFSDDQAVSFIPCKLKQLILKDAHINI